jgi:CRP-like cAMP-binding protein
MLRANLAALLPAPDLQPEASEALQFLKSLASFSGLPARELRALAEASRSTIVNSGEYLSHEGDDKSIYGFIVQSGRVAMIATSMSGKELIVELLPPGDMFGVVMTLVPEPLGVQLSARAQMRTKLLWLPIAELSPILTQHPNLYHEFVAHLFESLLASYKFSRGLAHDRVEVRIAVVLSNLALKFARRLPAPQNHTIDITRQQLADLTGTTTETAIRITRAMQRANLIDISRPGIVRVLNLAGMKELADGESILSEL